MPSASKPLGGATAVDLDPDVFGQPFNGPLVHETVIAELAARRRGTAATKTRGMVAGGTSKPWRQKGTGRARQGSTRSPQWIGGGTVFGPSPRHYTVKVNRKARRAALRAALSVHAERGSLHNIDPNAFGTPSTKQALQVLGDVIAAGRTLVVCAADEANLAKSVRNLRGIAVLPVDNTGVADLVGAVNLVVTPAALEQLQARARKQERVTA